MNGLQTNSKFKQVYPVLLGFSCLLFLISGLVAISLAADFTVLFAQFGAIIPLPSRFALHSAPVCFALSFLSLLLCVTLLKTKNSQIKFFQLAKAATLPLFLLSLITLPTLLVYLYLPIARAA